MSDLQCPATMLVLRHGDAEGSVAGLMSDDGGALTDRGRDQVRHLVEQVRSRRVAAVYSSRMKRAIESAELAAAAIPRLSNNLRNDLAAQRFLPSCVPAELEIDADGWRVVTWPGATELMDQVTN